MQIYLVGGAVRDELLGLAVKDKDYVVVGSTPEEMESAGFKRVGKDFPVFLHPQTHDEYALARTERKTARGYKGFTVDASVDVTLEEDLARRDLTINAIAKDSVGKLIDPYKGLADIQSKTLRHVSDAFAEDPVRILRAARLSARFSDFSVAPETNQLMQKMVDAGEVDALVAERVWQELAKGLMEEKPSRMFDVLRACGALQKILPELDKLWGVPQPPQHHPEIDTGVHVMMVIDYAAKQNFSLAVRFSALMHDLGKGETPFEVLPRHIGHEERSMRLLKDICKRLRVPNDCKELAQIVAKFHGKLHQSLQMRPSTLLDFLIELDAIRQPARFKEFIKACEADSRGRAGFENSTTPAADLMIKVLEAASSIDAGLVASEYTEPEKIKIVVFEARLKAVKQALQTSA
ncbi:multifunctional CCA addition/repair protein [Methylotenera sp.]|uniref:multifunctional CCA addition/repair protein n=1 Tax=Methylotenera sp. TaxID=2051956 RepID=UPI002719B836|nr:multifunctional CCA addition/repair protein [Methylotenera sp.]MDO9206386.1 multifunctional CCA addition/repair protein [Methylotenera sp.]MDO9392914.1 multifunctional CCA addition/repair protein [Methylotenera sp.]MDP1521799.1 multifunctional CCA addition/repair protein [Methylotenera sp.]MDP2070741.1 multifunctional CCA addition/repair protein [Methylotenera sp.]MDP2231397.1 multifunctional CCA addition/repair protein [Methylotenera sp.]